MNNMNNKIYWGLGILAGLYFMNKRDDEDKTKARLELEARSRAAKAALAQPQEQQLTNQS